MKKGTSLERVRIEGVSMGYRDALNQIKSFIVMLEAQCDRVDKRNKEIEERNKEVPGENREG